MSDLIDRKQLIEELEGLKLACGDIFFAAILNRAIQCVMNQPAVESGEGHE